MGGEATFIYDTGMDYIYKVTANDDRTVTLVSTNDTTVSYF